MPRCPNCKAEIREVFYRELGRKLWINGKWVEDESFMSGEFECRCPKCGYGLTYPEMEELGMI